MKRKRNTKKQAYTEFLRQCSAGLYFNLPRKEKKKRKIWAIDFCYYSKKRRVARVNPLILQTPMPGFIHTLFSTRLPQNHGSVMTFRRYNPLEST